MSLLKVNEVQNYNGSSLTLTASTVSTSAQLNTGGNISVTGSINVSDDSTTRSNLGLGSIATQDSDNVTVTGGTATLGALTVSGSGSGDLVRITQTGSGNALVVEDSANPDATPFVINTSGRVLSGLQTPIVTFFNNTPGVQINNQFSVQNLALSRFSDNNFGNAVDFVKSRSSNTGEHSIVASGDKITDFNFGGSDGTNFILSSRITAEVDGTPGTNDMPGRLVFSTTADGASSPTERMRIDSSGTVSITSGYVTLNNNKIGGIQVTVADDAYAEITPPRIGMHLISITGYGDNVNPTAGGYFIGYVDFNASPAFASISTGSSFQTSSSGPPSGTTGNDGYITLFAGGTSGSIYLENRKGFTMVMEVTFL